MSTFWWIIAGIWTFSTIIVIALARNAPIIEEDLTDHWD